MRISDWSSDVCSSDLQDLPDAAEFEIFPSLVANPEPPVAEHLQNAGPFAEHAAADHHGERDEQQMGDGRQPARFVTAQGDRKSTRLNPVTNAQLVCRLLLENKKRNNKRTDSRNIQ